MRRTHHVLFALQLSFCRRVLLKRSEIKTPLPGKDRAEKRRWNGPKLLFISHLRLSAAQVRNCFTLQPSDENESTLSENRLFF